MPIFNLFIFLLPRVCLFFIIYALTACQGDVQESNLTNHSEEYAGSKSCISCHKKFYDLWAPSHHGKAMQPFTAEFAKTELTFPGDEIRIGQYSYEAVFENGQGWILEKQRKDTTKYRMVHALGGKNIFFFLTPLDRGHLQVLPLGYHVKEKKWYNTTASMVRHFTDIEDEALNWKEEPLTFNTSCYGCHVSQLATNYDLATDTYHTTWQEPGINCETCHGPSLEHVRVTQEAEANNEIPEDLKIISYKDFNNEQVNSSCTPCHAKLRVMSGSFMPGERFLDYFDVVTFEDRDYYPDGRDLGENYTYTSWRMSPCVKSGQLNCLHCHTSSGRYRFKDEEKANHACLPCHEERVNNVASHSFHKTTGPGGKCISCHMPMTEFSFMKRSDHSMLPPTPAATITYQSPNACTICHSDKSPQWADKWVTRWHGDGYQQEKLYIAGLISAAQSNDWSRLDEMGAYIQKKDHDEIFTTSLIRLLQNCDNSDKLKYLYAGLYAGSPLVRSAAVEALSAYPDPEVTEKLLGLIDDNSGIVRHHAAAALSQRNLRHAPANMEQKLTDAFAEYEASLKARVDLWTSHYNLGNFYSAQGRIDESVKAYETAIRLRPDAIIPNVNLSVLYSTMGKFESAYRVLNAAKRFEPDNYAVRFNLGLLLANMGRKAEAISHLQKATELDPNSAQAFYNLAVLSADGNSANTINLSKRAAELAPDNHKYGYTHVYYLEKEGMYEEALEAALNLIHRFPWFADAYLIAGLIFEKEGSYDGALDIYSEALDKADLKENQLLLIQTKMKQLTAAKK